MSDKKSRKSTLSVTGGVDQPSSVNRKAIEKFRKARTGLPSPGEWVERLRSGDRSLLSKAITLVESSLDEHQAVAQELIRLSLPYAGNSLRVGITGVPGAGKSTFIESFGTHLTGKKHRLAVLAIDPSSSRSSGSILGDKTRMPDLSSDPRAFIRPSPSGGSLGGVARKTRESIILCEAAGYDIIIVETVGVGQSETAVHSMVDFFLLLMIPGAGDELQGMKRGIMEMADAIAINKADGDNIDAANRARSEFANALHLFPLPLSGWPPRVKTCSSVEGVGIREIWKLILDYKRHSTGNGFFKQRRANQATYWMHETIRERIQQRFFSQPGVSGQISELEKAVLRDELSSFQAAAQLLERFFPGKK